MKKINVNFKAVFAEYIAMTLFVYVGCGSVLQGNVLGVALAFGLSITSLAYSVGHISGGHMNPIVTIAFCIWGELDIVSGILYICAQLVGAITGSGILSVGLPAGSISNVVNAVNEDNITVGGAFMMEATLSFLLVFVVGQTAVSKKSQSGNFAPIAIGIAVFMAHIVMIPRTGCSINPARSFGPSVVSGRFEDMWLFFAAPITGGVVAALVLRFIFDILVEDEESATSKANVGKRDLDHNHMTFSAVPTPTTLDNQSTSHVEDENSFTTSATKNVGFPVKTSSLDDEMVGLEKENAV
mmetsp:Transcript_5019/g.6491  ORF Transcript_5019/g.6491 Transcript_5019/m.6491 type:complete len:298 (+) Transcript_5019:193-1086(+)